MKNIKSSCFLAGLTALLLMAQSRSMQHTEQASRTLQQKHLDYVPIRGSSTAQDPKADASMNGNVFSKVSQIPSRIMKSLDAVVVLGGGAPTSLTEPPLYVQARCDVAAEVVQLRAQDAPSQSPSLPILTLSAGTAHVPQFSSSDGLPIWESTASAAYLQSKYNLTNLYVETTSYDTIGNAFYTRTSHTDWNGWRHLLVITSAFHMERSKAIFDWIFCQAPPLMGYHISYLIAPNVGLTSEAIKARRDKEAGSLKAVQRFEKQYPTMADVYQFLTQQHGFYTASKLIERAATTTEDSSVVSDLVKKSYGQS
eukprot:CAMPEP_0172454382 /NCGR_PEP_ID=MMETSP1065-20121228/11392_1 /TAXON_ID=265537 /ORGANISM="Amphiprora paludosa, Strain CCMP125" /LENGTH=310 /DNA_ID=CAMNT_0013206703 /DNA_START=170 /DNA_END=1102 /DNA_ORIENTATION=+